MEKEEKDKYALIVVNDVPHNVKYTKIIKCEDGSSTVYYKGEVVAVVTGDYLIKKIS